MYKIIEADPLSVQALTLTRLLFNDLELKYGKGSIENFYNENNSLLIFLITVDSFNTPVACGGLIHFSSGTCEVKRMFVIPEQRGKGLAKKILSELENCAVRLNYKQVVLETGRKQPEAISLYEQLGYSMIECYGKFRQDPDSVCFKKIF